MLLLQCTRALLRRLDVPSPADPEELADTWLGPWYADIVPLGGLDVVLFVNEPSLYAVPIAFPGDAPPSDVGPVFRGSLVTALIGDGIGLEHIQNVLVEYQHVVLTKTTNRSTLGSMSDLVGIMIAFIESHLDEFGAVGWTALQRKLSRVPQRKLGWEYAVDVLRERLGED